MYQGTDKFIRFWYAFVFPNLSELCSIGCFLKVDLRRMDWRKQKDRGYRRLLCKIWYSVPCVIKSFPILELRFALKLVILKEGGNVWGVYLNPGNDGFRVTKQKKKGREKV